MTSTDLLSARQAAERIDCSVRQIARLVERGELEPAWKGEGLRGQFLFKPETVDAYLAGPETGDAA